MPLRDPLDNLGLLIAIGSGPNIHRDGVDTGLACRQRGALPVAHTHDAVLAAYGVMGIRTPCPFDAGHEVESPASSRTSSSSRVPSR